MKMRVIKMTPEEWGLISEKSHGFVFDKSLPKAAERISYALVVGDAESDRVYGYVTCVDVDPTTVYWKFGGAYAGTKDTIASYRAYEKLINWCDTADYKYIATRIENTNSPMLRMALKVGFIPIGVRNFDGIFLELILKLKE